MNRTRLGLLPSVCNWTRTWQGRNATRRLNRMTAAATQDEGSLSHCGFPHTSPSPLWVLLHAQISQSSSSQKRGSCQRTWFLLCLLIGIHLNEMQIGLVCVLSNASSFFKGVQRYGHTHWVNYRGCINKAIMRVLGWRGECTTCKTNVSVSWVFTHPGWFTWAACHILSWWPPFS